MAKLRAGVIGVGYLGAFHAEKYHALPGVDLAAVVDTDSQRAQQLASQLQSHHVNDYRDILDQLDLVSIAVPTLHHFAIARDCLDAGVHVLLEKPIADTPAQAAELVKRAERCGCLLQIGHLERFNPVFVAARERIQRPLFIETHRLAPFRARGTDVDVLLDLMIHDIDLLLTLVDSEISGIHAAGVPVLTRHIDIANVRIEFRNGCVANLTASRVSREPMRKFRIFEPEGYFSLDTLAGNLEYYQREAGAGEHGRINHFAQHFADGDHLLTEIRAFVDAVAHRRPPEVSGHDGRRALEIAVQIQEQLNQRGYTQQPLTLGEPVSL